MAGVFLYYDITETCNQTIIVIDNELPSSSCPRAEWDHFVEEGICFASFNLDVPMVTDNCGVFFNYKQCPSNV